MQVRSLMGQLDWQIGMKTRGYLIWWLTAPGECRTWTTLTWKRERSPALRFRINSGAMNACPSSRRIGQGHAFYKVILEEESGRILGAHLFGHNAGEAINIFAMAMKFGLSKLDLKKMLWAYPTNVSDLKYMID